jgi:hypothetical protein
LLALFVIFCMNYELIDFLKYGIILIIIWTVWVYYACVVNYWFPSYYYIICYFLKRHSNENDIKYI